MPSEVITWIEPDGTPRLLSDLPAIGILRGSSIGRAGAFMPPADFVEDRVPLQPGTRVRSVRVGARDVDLPLFVQEADNSALRTKLRAMLGWFDPSRGDGTLRVQAPDGSERELTCRLAGGLGLRETENESGLNWQQTILVLRGFDPYWYARNAITASYVATSVATFFPFFPLRLTSSTVFGTSVLSNSGDVDGWPVWTVTGPGSGLTIRNLTTGKLLSLSATLAGGETVTIDTRPSRKTVRLNDGTNLYGSLAAGSSLWPLARGSNTVMIELSGSTTPSSVLLSYYPRYLGP